MFLFYQNLYSLPHAHIYAYDFIKTKKKNRRKENINLMLQKKIFFLFCLQKITVLAGWLVSFGDAQNNEQQQLYIK